MHCRLVCFLILLHGWPSLAHAEGENIVKISSAADSWENALPTSNQHQSLILRDTPRLTELRAAILAPPLTTCRSEQEAHTQTAHFLKTANAELKLKIDWPATDGTPIEFRRALHPNGSISSSYRLGKTTITRTVIASQKDRAIFIHFHADQPGWLNFQVSLDGPAHVHGDREIIAQHSSLRAHLWVIPFESEATTVGNSLQVQGEGEALIILNLSTHQESVENLAATWKNLAAHHAPGQTPPDVSRIWHSILTASQKAAP